MAILLRNATNSISHAFNALHQEQPGLVNKSKLKVGTVCANEKCHPEMAGFGAGYWSLVSCNQMAITTETKIDKYATHTLFDRHSI